MKKCSICKQDKDMDQFKTYMNRGYKLTRTFCRDCGKKRTYADDNRRLFSQNRELALDRDGYACFKCGMTREEHKRRFNKDITVDHIDGTGANTPRHLKNNELSNLQTLCLICHGRKDNRFYGTGYGAIFNKPVAQCTLDGQTIKIWPSRVLAAKAVAGTKSGVSSVIYGREKTYKGYIWKDSPADRDNKEITV